MRYFIVTGNVPNNRIKTVKYCVVCSDIEKAITLTKKAFDVIEVVSVSDQGKIDKVDVG